MGKKRIALVILFSYLINICSVSASDEIALKSRRFTPAKGITAAAKTKESTWGLVVDREKIRR